MPSAVNDASSPIGLPARRPALSWRARLVVGLIGLCWLVLAARLVQLQWLERARFGARAQRQRTFVESLPARPGDIVDRAGRLLATTVTRQSLSVVPSRVTDAAGLATSLAGALQLDASTLQARIEQHRTRHFLWIKRRLSDAETQAVRRLDLPPEIWGFRQEYQRRYPQGRLAAHVIGLRDIDGRGRGGIEQSFDAVLRGRDGVRVLLRDARGRVVEIRDAAAQAPQHGGTVALTIDTVVQLLVEDELDRIISEWRPQGACVTVLDPGTAEILAMASRPSLDPDNPSGVPPAAWKNRNLVSMYEPGSTFKPFVVAWAMRKGVLRPDEEFDCEQGAWRMGRRILHDHHPYGVLSLTDVLVKSSNIGMAKIGQRLTNEGLYEATVAFGFGSRTGVELPGELHGLVHPLPRWTSYSTGSIPMGQELAVTPLQLITAHAALANGGTLMKPQIVLRGNTPRPPVDQRLAATLPPALRIRAPVPFGPAQAGVVSRTVPPEIAGWLVRGPMVEVVSRGTGRRARIESASVFGKTGTAQKFDPQTGTYSATGHVCSFIGGAPAGKPRVLVLVVVDEPSGGADHTGGSVAAPSGGRLLEQILRTLGETDAEHDSAG
jgi:cell division protein FtsI/penicillin-binding protein 2